MPDPWERQPEESGVAHAAFITYRDLGITRTLNAAWRKSSGRSTGAPGTWRTWSKTHRWPERSLAFDAHESAVRQRAADKAAAEAGTTSASERANVVRLERRLTEVLLAKFEEMAAFPVARRRVAIDEQGRTITVHEPMRWTFKNMIEMARVISQLERIRNRMPTVVDDDAPAEDLADLFFETDGQLESKLPDGAMPPMPPDVMAKPDIPPSTDAAGQAPPAQPPPLPPDLGKGDQQ